MKIKSYILLPIIILTNAYFISYYKNQNQKKHQYLISISDQNSKKTNENPEEIIVVDEFLYTDEYKIPMPPPPPTPTPIKNKQRKESFDTFKDKSYSIWVIATAYCPCKKCCGTCSPGITYTGQNAWKSGVAVDPKVIPLGSHLDIPGYTRGPNKNGSWILCDDIGGKIKGNRIDVRFKYHWQAKKWGKRKIKIKVHPKD